MGAIAGSTRPVRKAKVVAEWVCADPVPSLDLVLIDLADVGLPLLSEPALPHPASTTSPPRERGPGWVAESTRSFW